MNTGITYLTPRYCKVFQHSRMWRGVSWWTLIVFGTTDVSVKQQEQLYMRVVDGGVPCMSFVSLEYLEKAEATILDSTFIY